MRSSRDQFFRESEKKGENLFRLDGEERGRGTEKMGKWRGAANRPPEGKSKEARLSEQKQGVEKKNNQWETRKRGNGLFCPIL